MADGISFLPTATSVQVHETTGLSGTIPAATPRAAGVMTAAQARQLEAVIGKMSGLGILDAQSLVPPQPTGADPESLARLDACEAKVKELATGWLEHQLTTSQHVGSVEQRLADLEQRPVPPPVVEHHQAPTVPTDVAERIAALEQRVVELSPAAAPHLDDPDMPAFLRRDMPPGAAPAVNLDTADLVSRVEELEARVLRARPAPPLERIAAAVRDRVSHAPPLRVVEAAHLARAGQEVPLAMMQRIGRAKGCEWEEAARSIIQDSDRAAAAAVEAYALAIEARARIRAGEDDEAVAAEAVRQIEAIGG